MNRRWSVWLRNRVIGLAELAVLLSLLGTAAGWFGRYHFVCDLCSHFRLQAVLGLLTAGVVLVALKASRILSVFGLVAGIGLLATLIPSRVDRLDLEAGTAKLMVFNVLTGNTRKLEVGEYIAEHDPDVVILLETDTLWAESVRKQLGPAYPHRLVRARSDNFGILVYSKFEFEKGAIEYFGEESLPSIDIVFRLKGQPLRIIGTHPLPPMSQGDWQSRNRQLAEIAQSVSDTNLPTVVCGDFNCGPWSPFFQDFVKVSALRDSSYGRWVRPTWTGRSYLLGLPIDHVLVSEELGVLKRQIGPQLGSDHRPITVEIGWKENHE